MSANISMKKTGLFSKDTIRVDTIAGLTAAAVVIPKAMAYATVAGLPVEVGLYTALLPVAIYAFLGSSRVLSVSSTATIAILTATQLGAVVPDGDPAKLLSAAATLSVLVGLLLVIAFFLRLGFVANFISSPVLTGFKAGIGCVIILDQAPKLLGLHIDKQGFFRDAASIFGHLPDTSVLTLVVSLAVFGILIGLEYFYKHSPAPLIVICGGIAAAYLFGLEAKGVSLVGNIPRGFPALIMPDLTLVRQLIPGALGIALMSYTETIAAGRAFAAQDDPLIKPNQELVATGIANVGGAFIGCMPAGGGTSQTAVVRSAGGRSQITSLVTAFGAVATMLLFAPFLSLLPNAALAAVVIVYSVGLIKPAEFLAILKVRTMEFRWAIIACLGVLVFGTLKGIVVAIVVSLITIGSKTAHPPVYVVGRKRGTDILRPYTEKNQEDETFGELLILRPQGSIYFINAQNIADKMWDLVAEYKPRVVVLDMSRVPDIEYSALEMMIEGEKGSARRGLTMWIAGFNPAVLELVRRSGLAEILGEERMFFNSREAILRYQAMQNTVSGSAANGE